VTINIRRSQWTRVATLFLILNGGLACTSGVSGQSRTGDALARDYLIHKVCIDPSGAVVGVDPYLCTLPYSLRNLAVGESLPYHKVDQRGVQRHDAYPVTDLNGREIIAAPFDFTPFGIFNPWGDGYDIFQIREGWVSAGATRDGGGFSTTFFGEGCKPYNGWVFFPVAALREKDISPGESSVPISGRYWEQNGEAWPGACPANYSRDTFTSWEFLPKFPFGSKDEKSRKDIDAIRSLHGFRTTPRFLENGHMEVFYFTRLYGITRWEVWMPAAQNPQPIDPDACGGVVNISHRGVAFVRTACRDWSAVSVPTRLEAPAVWPIPGQNLLKNFHFAEGVTHWNRSGESREGQTTNWSLRNSTAPSDVKFRQGNSQGVRYLAINCGGTCNGTQGVYQDVPVTRELGPGSTLRYGATVISEAGGAEIQIKVQQMGPDGALLSEVDTTASVDDKSARSVRANSLVRSSTYVAGKAPVMLDARATTIRYMVIPKSPHTIDILDTWLLR